MKKKKDRKLSDFLENAVTPRDFAMSDKDFADQNQFSAHKVFARDYDAKSYSKLRKMSKGLIITTITVLVVLCAFFIINSIRHDMQIVYAHDGEIHLFDVRVDIWGKIWPDGSTVHSRYIYSDYKDYGEMTGEAAELARIIDKYESGIVACSSETMNTLAARGYLADPAPYVSRVKSRNELEYGIYLSETNIHYGLPPTGVMVIFNTGQEISFEDADFISVTYRAGEIGSGGGNSLRSFFRQYFQYYKD